MYIYIYILYIYIYMYMYIYIYIYIYIYMRGGNLVSNRLCGVSVTIIIRACCGDPRETKITGDPRETSFLFQRLSVIIQCGNAAAFRGTFPRPTPDTF